MGNLMSKWKWLCSGVELQHTAVLQPRLNLCGFLALSWSFTLDLQELKRRNCSSWSGRLVSNSSCFSLALLYLSLTCTAYRLVPGESCENEDAKGNRDCSLLFIVACLAGMDIHCKYLANCIKCSLPNLRVQKVDFFHCCFSTLLFSLGLVGTVCWCVFLGCIVFLTSGFPFVFSSAYVCTLGVCIASACLGNELSLTMCIRHLHPAFPCLCA